MSNYSKQQWFITIPFKHQLMMEAKSEYLTGHADMSFSVISQHR